MSKGVRFKNRDNEFIYPCPFMPIGAFYKSYINENPSKYFGGSWSLVKSGYEREQIGSQVLYAEISGSGNVGKTNLIGAYYYDTIIGLFDGITIPNGHHREYRLSFQARTGGGNYITVFLNNIKTNSKQTWSGGNFRVIGVSDFFREGDIVLETTMDYSNPGTNLKYQVEGSSNQWNIRNIMVHGFITSDNPTYTWKRTR